MYRIERKNTHTHQLVCHLIHFLPPSSPSISSSLCVSIPFYTDWHKNSNTQRDNRRLSVVVYIDLDKWVENFRGHKSATLSEGGGAAWLPLLLSSYSSLTICHTGGSRGVKKSFKKCWTFVVCQLTDIVHVNVYVESMYACVCVLCVRKASFVLYSEFLFFFAHKLTSEMLKHTPLADNTHSPPSAASTSPTNNTPTHLFPPKLTPPDALPPADACGEGSSTSDGIRRGRERTSWYSF